MFFVCAAGKLNDSIQHNRRLLNSGKSSKNKRNNSVTVQEFEEEHIEWIQHDRPATKSPKAPAARPLSASFDDANEKNDGENEFDDEMLADGKILF